MSYHKTKEEIAAMKKNSEAHWDMVYQDYKPELNARLAHPYHPTVPRGQSLQLDFGIDPEYVWVSDRWGFVTVLHGWNKLAYWLDEEIRKPGALREHIEGVNPYAEAERKHKEMLAKQKLQPPPSLTLEDLGL